MALSKIIAEGVDLTDTFAFTGTVTGAGDVLDATTTVPSEGGAVTTSLVQGLAKSWVNFNGLNTIAIGDSLGITSIADSGVGRYDPSFSNNMNNANYAVTNSNSGGHLLTNNHAVQITSSYNLSAGNTTFGAFQDVGYVATNVTGDLA